MDMTFNQYWNGLIELAQDEGVDIRELEDLHLAQLKAKAKLYYKKDTSLFDCYEMLVEHF